MRVLGAWACAVLGLYVGTFVNLLVDRVPDKLSVSPLRVGCRRCPDASAGTRRLPLLPWVLRRRCPTCGEGVLPRYALIEVVTGLLFGGAVLRFGADPALPAYLVFFASLVAVSVIDLEHQIIPNRIVYPTIMLCLPLLALAALAEGDLDPLVRALVGAAAAWVLLFVVHLISPAGMGFGDVRLAFVLGLFLGWLSLGHVVSGVFLGFVLGAVVGLGLVLFSGRSRKDSVPFGPFLAGGAVLAVFFGRPLIDWWLGT